MTLLARLRDLFAFDTGSAASQQLYIALVAQARQSFFYSRLGVPDTLDGRFDLLALHLFLILHRLKRENSPEIARLRRELMEACLRDMDRNLREMGVGDTGVGRRVKTMNDGLFGRIHAYDAALAPAAAAGMLEAALQRNVYAQAGEVNAAAIAALADYARRSTALLDAFPAEQFLAGEHPEFPEISTVTAAQK